MITETHSATLPKDELMNEAFDSTSTPPNETAASVSPWRKALVVGAAGLTIAGGSLGVAALSPGGIAGAQDDAPTDTTEQAPSETDAPDVDGPGQADHFGDVIGSLVEDGTITQDQADTIGERFAEARAEFDGRRPGLRGRPGIRGAVSFDVVTEVTGLTQDEIREGLRNGETLAELAGDNSEALAAAMVDAANERIDAGVESERLTEERAEELRAQVEQQVQDRLNGELGRRGGRHGN